MPADRGSQAGQPKSFKSKKLKTFFFFSLFFFRTDDRRVLEACRQNALAVREAGDRGHGEEAVRSQELPGAVGQEHLLAAVLRAGLGHGQEREEQALAPFLKK